MPREHRGSVTVAGVPGAGGAVVAGGGELAAVGEIATEAIGPVWPERTAVQVQVARSQILAVPSRLPLASRLPSGENATEVTSRV
ncbi:hypothetical protein GCM10010495_19070 [Kitasatospora herbaricolor]|nr:hypothetical protein [Kitasatospora herbaricolor]MDQ0308353.1 hypothetical protein [Kitasatospora herbaricolor]GGV06866.1 hypothetical protein GCM10010495_19070 [Kitasatospora herbaricolor]